MERTRGKPRSGKPFSFKKRPRVFPALNGLGAFSWAYRNAAQLLYRSMVSDVKIGGFESGPLVFLYRHSIETRLLSILELKGKRGRSHDLNKLMGDLKPLLAGMVTKLSRPSEKCVGQMAAIDPKSVTYRYPGRIDYHSKEFDLQQFVDEVEATLDELQEIAEECEEEIWAHIRAAEGLDSN